MRRRPTLTALLGALALLPVLALAPAPATAQCMLANPSFEIGGSDGWVFGGWYDFGPVARIGDATHGADAVRITGPASADWSVAGVWQPLVSAPGDRWRVTVRTWHPADLPLRGGSKVLVNVEWRDGAGELIDYETHSPVTSTTPVDDVVRFTVDSGAAPAGTAQTRLLLAVLQDPGAPVGAACFDQATFDPLEPTALADLQWNDFPGGRTLAFAGRSWRVKGPGYYGPGPNLFCDSSDCTWVDAQGQLHLTISNQGSSWYSTEVVLEDVLGYGDYIFTTRGRLDLLDPTAVLGLFLWQYGPCYDPAYLWWNPYEEIDIEFSRWGDPNRDLAQFVAQPFDWGGNIDRFDVSFAPDEITSHAFRWLHDRVEYRSWRGGPDDESPATRIHAWTYTGPHIPRPGLARVHLNLWQAAGAPATEQEVVLQDFTFVSACPGPDCDEEATAAPATPTVARARLLPAAPNPFNPRTTLRWVQPRDGEAVLTVHDRAGRTVAVLFEGTGRAGENSATWNGKDGAGRTVASGVYFARLRAAGVDESRPVVLLK